MPTRKGKAGQGSAGQERTIEPGWAGQAGNKSVQLPVLDVMLPVYILRTASFSCVGRSCCTTDCCGCTRGALQGVAVVQISPHNLLLATQLLVHR